MRLLAQGKIFIRLPHHSHHHEKKNKMEGGCVKNVQLLLAHPPRVLMKKPTKIMVS